MASKLCRIKRAIALAVMVGAAILLFVRLGHYALWDDEALTALPALGVWRTGDTTAVIGDNIVAYRNGAQLIGLRVQRSPPLRFYLAAPSLGLLGPTAFAARLPFAICGLAAVVVLLLGLKWARADLTTWILMAEAILGNVSFFLFCRQCRYYAPAILVTSSLALLYVFWNGRRRSVVAFALLSVILLTSNYLNYLAFYACLAADYLIWGRKRRPLTAGDWLWLILPQALIVALIIRVWHPVFADFSSTLDHRAKNWLAEKVTLFWWNWRDLNQCEFGAVLLMVLAPLIFARTRRDWLLRLPLAVFIYVAVITITSQQPVWRTDIADVRYLAPMIPLCMAIGVLCVREICPQPIPAALLGMIVFGTNLVHGGPSFPWGLRSTIVSYVQELARPPGDPYTTAAQWINANVPPGCSIFVGPHHMAYPLMFHAPRAVYAWQFEPPPAPGLEGLPPIHFSGIELPDFVVAFGPLAQELEPKLQSPRPGKFRYEETAVLDIYGEDKFRPELHRRSFRAIPVRNPATEAIHIYRRVVPPIHPRRPRLSGPHPQTARGSAPVPGLPPAEGWDSLAASEPGSGVEPPVDLVAAYAEDNLGEVYFGRGNFEAAAAHFTKAIRLHPQFASAHNNLGTTLSRLGRYAEAKAHFAEAIRLQPSYFKAHLNLGLSFSRLGDFKAAKEQFAEAIRLEPADPNAFNASAMIMAACPEATFRDGKRAVAFATRACELTNWKNPTMLDTLAAAQAEAGDFSAAVLSQKKALELLSDDQQKVDYRSRLVLYQGQRLYRQAPP